MGYCEVYAAKGESMRDKLIELLQNFKDGSVTIDDVLDQLKILPFEDIGIAKIDHHRILRHGVPEVIFGKGKTKEQLIKIVETFLKRKSNILITKLSEDNGNFLKEKFPELIWFKDAGAITYPSPEEVKIKNRRVISVVSAGTADYPVAMEAYITGKMLGNKMELITDVGVAGLHRLLPYLKLLEDSRVIIVVAGMEGALPSVIGGIVSRPIIAVPTSVGYGANFRGLSALLAMLNSCVSSVAVVNIDNGFGAAYFASMINREE